MVTIPYTSGFEDALTRSSTTAAELRRALLRGEFKANQHLGEAALAERLGVSRTPIREALNTLAQEGLVTYQPNRGYVVTACTYDDIVGAYLVRRSLESLACRLAARNGLSLEQRVRMMQSIEEGQKLIDCGAWKENLEAWGALNSAFHAAIIDAARNLPLARAINDTLRMPIMISGGEEKQFTRYDMLAYFDDDTIRKALSEHSKILDHIVAREEDLAAETMDRHIARAGKMFEDTRADFEARLEPSNGAGKSNLA